MDAWLCRDGLCKKKKKKKKSYGQDPGFSVQWVFSGRKIASSTYVKCVTSLSRPIQSGETDSSVYRLDGRDDVNRYLGSSIIPIFATNSYHFGILRNSHLLRFNSFVLGQIFRQAIVLDATYMCIESSRKQSSVADGQRITARCGESARRYVD